jgi:hypothetical protein
MKNIKELADEYIKSCKYTEKIANQIAQMIVEACKPIIKDMKYSIGWQEAGIDTICFYSETHIIKPSEIRSIEEKIRFIEVIQETFPELSELWAHIDTPWGFWLTKEEAEQIKQLLLKEIKQKEVKDECQ